MSDSNLPVILIEVVLIFGGTLLFGWWQLRSVRRDRESAAAKREAEHAALPNAGARVADSTSPQATTNVDPSPGSKPLP